MKLIIGLIFGAALLTGCAGLTESEETTASSFSAQTASPLLPGARPDSLQVHAADSREAGATLTPVVTVTIKGVFQAVIPLPASKA